MPQFVHATDVLGFNYDPLNSTPLTGSSSAAQFVSTFQSMNYTDNASITLNGSTAGFELWASNGNYDSYRTPIYMVYHDTQYSGNIQNFQINTSFSATLVNITNEPCVKIGASGFYVSAPFRYLQLQGNSVTANCNANQNICVGYFWSHDCVNGPV